MSQAKSTSSGGDRAYRALQHRDFLLLWLTEGVSTCGSQITRAVIAWQVFKLTDDPFQLGLLGLCRFVPVIIFGIAGGVLADRRDRRTTLLGAQIGLLLCSAMLALLTFSHSIPLAAIYLLTVLSAIVESVSNPARQALIPAPVPRKDLAGATTMSLLIFHLAAVGGPRSVG